MAWHGNINTWPACKRRSERAINRRMRENKHGLLWYAANARLNLWDLDMDSDAYRVEKRNVRWFVRAAGLVRAPRLPE